jgi:zinc protease
MKLSQMKPAGDKRTMRRLGLCMAIAYAISFAISCAATAGPRFSLAKSPGGIPFYYLNRPSDAKAILAFGWRDGLAAAEPGMDGLRQVGPSALMLGPKAISEGEMIESFNDLHADGDLSSDMVYTSGSIEAPPEKLDAAMILLASVILDPALRDKGLARLKKQLRDNARESEQNGESLALRVAAMAGFADHPYARALGASIYDNITREDIDAWRKRVFARDNLTIAASGSLDEAAFGAIVDHAFGELPEKSELEPMHWPDIAIKPRTIVFEKDVPQTIVAMIGVTGVKAGVEVSKDNIANTTLGASPNSRLSEAVRAKLGAAYGISSRIVMLQPDQRILAISTALSPDRALPAIAAMREVYANWRRDGVREDEFAPNRARYLNQFEEGLDRPGAAARTLIDFAGVGLESQAADLLATIDAKVAAYTLDDVSAEIERKFPEPPLLTVIVAPKADGFSADCVIHAISEAKDCK